jgi:hypothetical protein
MRNPAQLTPLISVAQNRSCRLNKAAMKLINPGHGDCYKLISFGSETRLLKTDNGPAQIRVYKNENYSLGGVELIRQLSKIFPTVIRFEIEPIFDNQYSLKPY